MTDCPFCAAITRGQWLARHDAAVALADRFPLTPGHTLVVPVRCEADYFRLAPDEKRAMWALIDTVQARLATQLSPRPTSWTIGINNGADAGQTIPHCHIHLIPRRPGDHPNPRGGLRQIFPDRAAWWEEALR